jgi:conjugal transfer pilus assembly protein TraK
VLQPVDMPLETIVLRDRGESLAGAGGAVAVAQGVSDTPFPKNTSHVRAIKAMWLTMAGDTVPRDVQVRAMNREVTLWKEARFVLDRVYVANTMVGELYTLTTFHGNRWFWPSRVAAMASSALPSRSTAAARSATAV